MTLHVNMLGEILVWCLKWYYITLELWATMFKVLKIKFRTIKSAETANLVISQTKGHLAIRLNDTKVLTSSELIELIEYACKSFGVKYLTIVCGHKGFDKELELANTVNGVNISIYHNFEVVSEHSRPMTLVNLIDVDSQTIFLSKIKAESINQANEAGIVYKSAVDSFTGTHRS